MVSTAGVPLRISLREPPSPVTTRIMADTLRPSSTQALVAALRCSGVLMLR